MKFKFKENNIIISDTSGIYYLIKSLDYLQYSYKVKPVAFEHNKEFKLPYSFKEIDINQMVADYQFVLSDLTVEQIYKLMVFSS